MPVDRESLLRELQTNAPELFKTHASVYEPLLDAVLAQLDEQGRLDAQGLKQVEQRTQRTTRASRRGPRRQLVRLLSKLNETGRVEAVVPVEKTYVRPALLPVSLDQAQSQITASAMDRYVDDWLAGRTDENGRLLALAVRLVARVGLGERVVTGVLARLTPADIVSSGTIALPINVTDFSGACYTLRPPKACRDLFPRFKSRTQRNNHESLLFSTLGTAPTTAAQARERQDTVRQILTETFRAFAADFRAQAQPGDGIKIGSWRRFAHAARLLPLGRGVPPVLVDVMAQFPLPASATTDGSTLMPLWRGETTSSPNERNLRPATHDEREAGHPGTRVSLRAPGPIVLASEALPEDWPRRVRNLLAALVNTAKELTSSRGFVPKSRHHELHAKRDDLLTRADEIRPSASILHVALAWSTAKIVQDKVKTSTLDTYVSRLFSRDLLMQEETADLTYWDDETIEELTAHVIASRNWNARTEESFRTTWADFLRYAQSIDLLTEAQITIKRGGETHRATRTAIVAPYEFDYLWRCLHEREADRVSIQWGVALTLGYYGGLRASEVLGLTLADIYDACGELWVHIRAGKTPAARRDIPLHLIAPDYTVDQVRRWTARRGSDIGRASPQSVGLFGPAGEAEAYDRHGLGSRDPGTRPRLPFAAPQHRLLDAAAPVRRANARIPRHAPSRATLDVLRRRTRGRARAGRRPESSGRAQRRPRLAVSSEVYRPPRSGYPAASLQPYARADSLGLASQCMGRSTYRVQPFAAGEHSDQ